MTWADHVHAIKTQWIIRYMQPCEAAWKHVLDAFLLKHKQGSKLQYPLLLEIMPEGRLETELHTSLQGLGELRL